MIEIKDAYLIETGDGGDLVLLGNDIKTVGGLENMIYLALFGGNVNGKTTGPKIDAVALDYWGNFVLNPSNQNVWFNSTIECLMKTTALNTGSRIKIEQNVLSDLKFMNDFANISVEVTLPMVDRVKIRVVAIEKNNLQSNEFVYIWDATQQEIDSLPNASTSGAGIGLDNVLDFDL